MELNLEAIRRKAANPVTATDHEWASIVNALLLEIEELDDELRELRSLVAGAFWH